MVCDGAAGSRLRGVPGRPPTISGGTERAFALGRGGSSRGAEVGAAEAARVPRRWLLGEPDLVVSMTSPFEMPVEGPDVFRNFQVPLECFPSAEVGHFRGLI